MHIGNRYGKTMKIIYPGECCASAEDEFIATLPEGLHDGAVLINYNKINAAGCILPLSTKTDLADDLGTRHRAAIGITEETDALAIVVSEERGSVSVAMNGQIYPCTDAAHLRRLLSFN